jgi:hypothetical protein
VKFVLSISAIFREFVLTSRLFLLIIRSEAVNAMVIIIVMVIVIVVARNGGVISMAI